MLKCHIVEDLLPGYIDGLLGDATTAEVRLHLDGCLDCCSSYEKMKSFVNTPVMKTTDKEVDFLKKVRSKALFIAVFLFILGVLLGIAGVYIGEMDDAPGAAIIGILLMTGLVVTGISFVWRKR